MRQIFRTLYGSHLFGCAVATSDEDYKSIHLEDLEDLLFKDTHAVNSKDETGPTKIEYESYSLRTYLNMLAAGQVIATDMFFAPKEFHRWRTGPLWDELLTLKPYVITRNITPFAGYARGQSYKYGSKGTKLKTVQKAIELLEKGVDFSELANTLKGMEGIDYSTEHAAGGDIQHIKICGKDFGETTDYKLWLDPLRRIEKQYGERARLSTNGIDLKAQYHAVRICSEAIELLSTGNLTFPRPEAPILRKIRAGKMQEEALRDLVDTKLIELTQVKILDSLPAKPDHEKIDDFIFSAEKDFLLQNLKSRV